MGQLKRIPAMAACDAGVLILDETGTGKELCPQAVHYLSSRADHPWVALNGDALPPELMESELSLTLDGSGDDLAFLKRF